MYYFWEVCCLGRMCIVVCAESILDDLKPRIMSAPDFSISLNYLNYADALFSFWATK